MEKKSYTLVQFGKKLRAERVACDVSQEKLAEKTKLSRNYIGSLERGEANPSLLTIEKVAKALRVESWNLLR
ncbi:MAG TPA: helix-turn-helix transcriptional regulator [Candidatus Paceibacterota bacterium]|nr:helix-turn-helix transcriptional regulator [Candidatus Paceibacterota bacterium]HMO83106.1 helix-turn-helix transcriptional regulator [Candidatus Paceibacterota bacterium]